tara:strand:+ start:44 stop:445 length:402 start_codon:yes stop_codon:yes gene_type:complete
MKTYTDLLGRLEEVKAIKSDKFTDIKLYFNETKIFIGGLLDGKGNVRGCDSANGLDVFTPTEKGFVSSSWKKTDFYKLGKIELTEELFNSLVSFIQAESPKHFIRKTEGWGVAGAIASHINSKVDYASNKMRQ